MFWFFFNFWFFFLIEKCLSFFCVLVNRNLGIFIINFCKILWFMCSFGCEIMGKVKVL